MTADSAPTQAIVSPDTVTPPANWVRVLAPMVIDVAVPTAVYYLLRHYGLGVIAASSLSGVAPVARSAYSWRRTGRPDLVAVAMVTALVAGTLAAVLMNSARLVLAKDGVITGLLGAWMLITLALRRPFMLAAGTAIATAKRGVRAGQAWAARWDADLRLRHGIRMVTAVWGVALVLDAVVRGTTGPTAAAT